MAFFFSIPPKYENFRYMTQLLTMAQYWLQNEQIQYTTIGFIGWSLYLGGKGLLGKRLKNMKHHETTKIQAAGRGSAWFTVPRKNTNIKGLIDNNDDHKRFTQQKQSILQHWWESKMTYLPNMGISTWFHQYEVSHGFTNRNGTVKQFRLDKTWRNHMTYPMGYFWILLPPSS